MANTSYSLGQTLLKIENVCLEYDGRPCSRTSTVRCATFRTGQGAGEVVGFLGPSGCGKTSLFGLSRGWTSLHRAG